MPIETTLDAFSPPSGWLLSRKQRAPNADQGEGREKLLLKVDAQTGAATVEVSVEVSQRAKPSTTVSQIHYLGI